ncbi:splicing factor 3B subunit 4 [Rhizophagus irregularis DAOM 181602=DAOM 197198]|nr:splicing factor 3B subunit 4 [Rhizophagus irregularis DAOM 181602=DAOM 197198]
MMNGQYLMNIPITVSYAFKKDGKGERHRSAAERISRTDTTNKYWNVLSWHTTSNRFSNKHLWRISCARDKHTNNHNHLIPDDGIDQSNLDFIFLLRCSTFGVNVPFVGKSGKPHTTSQKNPLKTINVNFPTRSKHHQRPGRLFRRTPPPDNDSYTIASDSSYITVIEPTSIGFPSASSRQFLQDCHRSNRDNQLPDDSSTQAPSAQDVERITISER